MKEVIQINDICYIIHRKISEGYFMGNMDIVKEWRDYLPKVDHVLRNQTHFLFVETIEDVEEIKDDIQGMVEEEHSI